MSSLSSLVAADGPLKLHAAGADVRALQIALSQAGYRVTVDPAQAFTNDTDYWVRQFQRQHGLATDGVVGAVTAALLDAPHGVLVTTAAPLVRDVPVQIDRTDDSAVSTIHTVSVPHDDTASLLAFYGSPWNDASLVGHVPCPWKLYYAGKSWPHPVPFHVKAAPALAAAMAAIWRLAGADDASPLLKHVRNYSGSYEDRAVRGSSRRSCHAFAVAIDFDADALPLARGVPASEMPQEVVTAFLEQGFFWGGNYRGRKDPMHFQLAHE